jgi:hypothetical protein
VLLHCHVTKLELEAVDRQRQAAASQLGKAKRSLQEIWMAETKTHAEDCIRRASSSPASLPNAMVRGAPA